MPDSTHAAHGTTPLMTPRPARSACAPAASKGAAGFFTGIVTGAAGVITKPVVGILDGASQCTPS